MATLSDTIKPNKTYLEAVLRTALLGKTEDEYVDFFLSGLRGRLLKNPRLYRSYGPYWPEIKNYYWSAVMVISVVSLTVTFAKFTVMTARR
ncbi:hypothetical protein ECEPECC34262_1725 [Escherichia coli EPEC C342-62]|nr:hypothetical protein ECEPECC34262_1725 [Escherichia coli EPEC C342-62]